MVGGKRKSLKDRTVYIPRMSYGGSRAFAAAFKYLGIDSQPVPEGDERTLELASKHTRGDECLPARVTLGNFLKITEMPGFDQSKAAFFMPTSEGPCRLGQYAPFMKFALKDMGYDDLMILSPSSKDGYRDLGDVMESFVKLGWMGIVGSDALRKMLHKYRPYEQQPEVVDRVYKEALEDYCSVLEDGSIPLKDKLGELALSLERAREAFRAVPADWNREVLLIGVIGEIFCRLSTFSNQDLIRKLERAGGRAWLSDISEWVWYTNEEEKERLKLYNRLFTLDMVKLMMTKHIQSKYEKRLLAPLEEEFEGIEEPHDINEILKRSERYLPARGAKGEMTLSVGKAIYLYEKGVDGIIDISPFTCMNGVISEAVYPEVSRDHDDIPIRTFYFDGTSTDLENDLEIFIELARNYNRRMKRSPAENKTA
ncbi:MAG: hypothetical protein U5O15_07810 [Candidatus Krumholzibacteriota bacterium]|nr:hypothetical protein [Candidatus Krumholzibacteriota bacterium]